MTALPTLLPTTKPTRLGRSSRPGIRLACTTTTRADALTLPRRRRTAEKSALERSRCCAGSTAARGQADSSERPLRRRAARMARPARVLMRARKPWFLARRRLLGWKVRLLTTVFFRSSLHATRGDTDSHGSPSASGSGGWGSGRPTAAEGLRVSAAIGSPRSKKRGHAKTADWPNIKGTAARESRSNRGLRGRAHGGKPVSLAHRGRRWFTRHAAVHLWIVLGVIMQGGRDALPDRSASPCRVAPSPTPCGHPCGQRDGS